MTLIEDAHCIFEQGLAEHDPVAVFLLTSGAYAKPGELTRLEQHFPETAAYIKKIERESGCPWRWEEAPPRRLSDEVGTLEDEFQPLCTSCNVRGRGA